ncbi:monocarboxylate transporter [Elysia marginata]|uniref:Monocarboxylate transporter n=1 Tax=Elysia marginata TaxID=1093978 RepID=A0AAV4I1G9_9GAST|nr:monocarboxylate transporter [Elysia marginata]
MSGSAVGNFMYPPLLTWLEDRMHWRGALIVMSGLMLQMAVFGALMRPAPDIHTNIIVVDNHEDYNHRRKPRGASEPNSGDVSSAAPNNQSSVLENHQSQPRMGKSEISLGVDLENKKDSLYIIRCADTSFTAQDTETIDEDVERSADIQNQGANSNNNLKDELDNLKLNITNACDQTASPDRGINNCHSKFYIGESNDLYFANLTHQISTHSTKELKDVLTSSDKVEKDTNIFYNTERKHDVFEFDKTVTLEKCQDAVNAFDKSISLNLKKLEQEPTLPSNTKPGLFSWCTSSVSHLKDTMSLLKNPFFATLAVSNFFTYLTFLMVPVYITDRAIESGVDKTKAALALSMYGAGNLVGRLGYGILADRCRIDSFISNAICLIICGISTCLSPLCGSDAVLHGVYGFVFGTFIGAHLILGPIILVELLGASMLSSSLGVSFMFRALGMLLGTPVAGWIYDATGSYTSSFIIHGTIIGLSGLIVAGIKMALLRSKRRDAAAATAVSVDADAVTAVGINNDAFVTDSSQADEVISTKPNDC